jgi:hypothetical protein
LLFDQPYPHTHTLGSQLIYLILKLNITKYGGVWTLSPNNWK